MKTALATKDKNRWVFTCICGLTTVVDSQKQTRLIPHRGKTVSHKWQIVEVEEL